MFLDKTNAPLHRLTMLRVQLDAATPTYAFRTYGSETLLYSLVGSVRLVGGSTPYGSLGQRRHVLDRAIGVLRVSGGIDDTITLTVEGYAADLLHVRCAPSEQKRIDNPGLYIHRNDAVWHDVGEGCYRRWVAEVPTPAGYELHCGQTISDGEHACWSSWPSHAALDEVARYAEHEEVFFVYTEGYGLMRMNGRYVTGEDATGVCEVAHNSMLVTPLGSHEIVFSPRARSTYVWCYISFLEKTYNKFADHGIRTYIK